MKWKRNLYERGSACRSDYDFVFSDEFRSMPMVCLSLLDQDEGSNSEHSSQSIRSQYCTEPTSMNVVGQRSVESFFGLGLKSDRLPACLRRSQNCPWTWPCSASEPGDSIWKNAFVNRLRFVAVWTKQCKSAQLPILYQSIQIYATNVFNRIFQMKIVQWSILCQQFNCEWAHSSTLRFEKRVNARDVG